MATVTKPETKVTPEKTLSATVRFSNNEKDGRKYDITADVNINDGYVGAFNNGIVKKHNAEDFMGNASFNCPGNLKSQVNISFNGFETAEQAEILAEIHAFVEDVTEFINSKYVLS